MDTVPTTRVSKRLKTKTAAKKVQKVEEQQQEQEQRQEDVQQKPKESCVAALLPELPDVVVKRVVECLPFQKLGLLSQLSKRWKDELSGRDSTYWKVNKVLLDPCAVIDDDRWKEMLARHGARKVVTAMCSSNCSMCGARTSRYFSMTGDRVCIECYRSRDEVKMSSLSHAKALYLLSDRQAKELPQMTVPEAKETGCNRKPDAPLTITLCEAALQSAIARWGSREAFDAEKDRRKQQARERYDKKLSEVEAKREGGDLSINYPTVPRILHIDQETNYVGANQQNTTMLCTYKYGFWEIVNEAFFDGGPVIRVTGNEDDGEVSSDDDDEDDDEDDDDNDDADGSEEEENENNDDRKSTAVETVRGQAAKKEEAEKEEKVGREEGRTDKEEEEREEEGGSAAMETDFVPAGEEEREENSKGNQACGGASGGTSVNTEPGNGTLTVSASTSGAVGGGASSSTASAAPSSVSRVRTANSLKKAVKDAQVGATIIVEEPVDLYDNLRVHTPVRLTCVGKGVIRLHGCTIWFYRPSILSGLKIYRTVDLEHEGSIDEIFDKIGPCIGVYDDVLATSCLVSENDNGQGFYLQGGRLVVRDCRMPLHNYFPLFVVNPDEDMKDCTKLTLINNFMRVHDCAIMEFTPKEEYSQYFTQSREEIRRANDLGYTSLFLSY